MLPHHLLGGGGVPQEETPPALTLTLQPLLSIAYPPAGWRWEARATEPPASCKAELAAAMKTDCKHVGSTP